MTQNQPSYNQGQQQGGYPPQPQYPSQDQYRNQYPSQNQYPQHAPNPPAPQYGEAASYYGQSQQQPPSWGSSRPAPSYNNTPPQQQPFGYMPPAQSSGSSSSPPPVPPHPSASAPPILHPGEEERGVLGALAGGAAGAYAGHKMGHGILGGLGGAFAGHKLEDTWKQHHQKPTSPQPPQAQGPPPAYPGPSAYGSPPVHMAGNFSASAAGVHMDHAFELRARCRRVDGNEADSRIGLNRVLGNDNGRFVWTGQDGNFGASARSVRLVDDGRVLEAELKNVEGHWQWARVWLDERIGNSDGQLVFV